MALTPKERMALINGSPCAAALVADVALAGRGRLELAESAFALVAEVCGAPDEHFAVELADLWGDAYEAAALASLRTLLDGSGRVRQHHQASVSVRILPRVLGAIRRAQAAAEAAATVALSSVTDNPVYLPPERTTPWARSTPTAAITTPGPHRPSTGSPSPTPICASSRSA